MQTNTCTSDQYPIVSSGPDYLTVTAKRGSASLELERIADREIQRQRDASGAIRSTSLLGYQGFQLDHLFFGRRHEDSMVRVSGPETPYLAKELIQTATNVSRLDLQVTVWTNGETPELAMQGYRHLTMFRRLESRPGQLTLVQSDPKGSTLNVNKRSSDCYGRLYDKATEADCGPARTIWRYEVEFKRRAAHARALGLADNTCVSTFTKSQVHSWWSAKGLEPRFSIEDCPCQPDIYLEKPRRDVLRWFEASVSITVARAVRHHGLHATVQALGLSALVQPK